MTLDKLMVLILSGLGVLFTYWFFLMKDEKTVAASDSVDITVEGGYNPEVISIPYGKTTKLNFLRKDTNSCLEEVVLADFRIRRYLPLNQQITVEVKPEQRGEFSYSCGMNMFHGKIVVN